MFKTRFVFCRHVPAISVASSNKFIFTLFYTTVPNEIVIKLTKLKTQNVKVKVSRGYKSISNKKNIQRKKSSKYTPVE